MKPNEQYCILRLFALNLNDMCSILSTTIFITFYKVKKISLLSSLKYTYPIAN